MKYNVYDFDKTIYQGDSTVDFYKYCFKKNPVMLLDLLPFGVYVLRYIFSMCSLTELKEVFLRFLKRIPDVEVYVDRFWETNSNRVANFFYDNKSDEDIVISASPEFLLAPICRELGIKHLIASKVDAKTGKFDGLNCKGSEKLRRLVEEMGEISIGNFYSDSLSDEPLAQMAEKAYMVRRNRLYPWEEYRSSWFIRFKNTYLTGDFLLFIFCGGMGTITNFICSIIISSRLDPILSYAIGYGISLFVSYGLNAKLIFKENMRLIDFLKFVISYIPNFIILFAFVILFINIMLWNKVVVYALAGLLGLPITFVLVKLFAFNRRD